MLHTTAESAGALTSGNIVFAVDSDLRFDFDSDLRFRGREEWRRAFLDALFNGDTGVELERRFRLRWVFFLEDGGMIGLVGVRLVD